MSDENCDGGNDSSNGKRRFYIDSILHRKKCDPPYKAAEGGYLLFFLLSFLSMKYIVLRKHCNLQYSMLHTHLKCNFEIPDEHKSM